jgi:hypothetical protein
LPFRSVLPAISLISMIRVSSFLVVVVARARRAVGDRF